MEWLDRLAAEILAPLAVWVLASGLDDLFLDLAYFSQWFRSRLRRGRGPAVAPEAGGRASPLGAGPDCPEPSVAILVPCWQEAAVIGEMIVSNLTAIKYDNYDIWLGVYPNDPATIACVVAAEARFPRVHHVVCPRDGPTTKADCLNAVYDGLCAHEERIGRRYSILLQHDAEDVIHRHSLDALREECARFDMVQIPVFPLRTPVHKFTHGVYCDEFAEYHLKELRARAWLGGFVPSAGVGTAYRREAIEELSRANGGRPFATESLTEDYVVGLELRRLGFSQTLLHAWRPAHAARPASFDARARAAPRRPIRRGNTELVATRAYFPFGPRAAIRQRSRWLTGNALQSWAHFGWRAGPGQIYWLWRDRKALIGSPASALANLLFFYGLARWVSLRGTVDWSIEQWVGGHLPLAMILGANLVILVWRQAVRAFCSLAIYGLAHACMAPLRSPWANFVNLCAMARAVTMFARSRALRRPLVWAKTVHCYPGPEAPVRGRRLLERILATEPARPTLGRGWLRPRLPRVEMRVSAPAWLVTRRRLTVTLEYRRSR